MELSEKLREVRKARGLSQKQLAELVSLTQVTISRLEHGRIKELKSGALIRLSRTLGVPIDELVGNESALDQAGALDSNQSGNFAGIYARLPERKRKLVDTVFELMEVAVPDTPLEGGQSPEPEPVEPQAAAETGQEASPDVGEAIEDVPQDLSPGVGEALEEVPQVEDPAPAGSGPPFPQASLEFRRKVYIGASVDVVWQALVNPEIVSQYFLCPLYYIDLKIGGELFFGQPDRRIINATIQEIVPGQRLVHSFSFVGHKMRDSEGQPEESRISYNLNSFNDLTEIVFVHDNVRERDQVYERIWEGWEFILCGMKTLIETGRTLKWPK